MSNENSHLKSALEGERRRNGVHHEHIHIGGSIPINLFYRRLISLGLRNLGAYPEFVARLLMRKPDQGASLDEYLEHIHAAEALQAGPEMMRWCVETAVDSQIERMGTIRTRGDEIFGSELDPFYTPAGILLRFNCFKRTGATHEFNADVIADAVATVLSSRFQTYDRRHKLGVIVSLGRDQSLEVNRAQAEKIRHWRKAYPTMRGVDIAGPENPEHGLDLSDPRILAEIADCYDTAAGEDGWRTAHVGETRYTDINTFVEVLTALKLDRVGHPIAAIRAYLDDKDDKGLVYMADNNIAAELCPWSNWISGAFTKKGDVPKHFNRFGEMLEIFDRYGIRYSINCDSPALQHMTHAEEVELLLSHGAITPEQLEAAFVTAEETSFLRTKQIT